MALFPVILDSRLPYLLGTPSKVSVALLPCGWETVAGHVATALRGRTKRHATVVRSFAAGREYDEALSRAGITVASRTPEDFRRELATMEPSDWVLAVDPRTFPEPGFGDPAVLDELLDDLLAKPRIARHLVALGSTDAGTSERLELDVEGRVRRIQRYYDAVTWAATAGVIGSLVPATALMDAPEASFGSLIDLRRALQAQGVASRDIPHRGVTFDLSSERGLLWLTERVVDAPAPPAEAAGDPQATVHPSVRVLGAVVIQRDATVAEQVTLIGPTVIGMGAHVHRGAVIAQSVLIPGAVVGEGAVVRHQVVTGRLPADHPADAPTGAMPDEDRGGVRLTEDLPRPSLYPKVKLVLEITVAALALVALSPLLLLLAVLIKLDSRGPAFYVDLREAKDGRPLRCYKLRTMVVDADAAQRDLASANQVDGPQFKMASDPRVTRLGRFLRASSLDELPQLINVMLGQMSLVGPRPSPFRENQTCVPWRDARLSVRPGITGLWQVCRHDRAMGDFHQWIYYDMQYVRHMSLLVDVKILLATVFTLGGKGHVPLRWILSGSREGTPGD